MKHTHKHKLNLFHWENGILKAEEHILESLEEALAFASMHKHYNKKIYNESGELIFVENDINVETYA